jgi:acyl-CoA synthetase (AMP-forming)/AMP-acid ligase II
MAANIMLDSTISEEPASSSTEVGWQTAGFLPKPSRTFPAVFAERLAADPDGIAFCDVSLDKHELQSEPHTLSHIERRARRAAHALARSGIGAGDRVLLCLGSAPAFLSVFLAAQALGAVPVPLPCSSEFRARQAFRERVRAIATDCGPRAIVVDSSHEADGLSDLASVLNANDLASGPGESVPPDAFRLDRSPSETAFLQYTSGSTGNPKGVVVKHCNLIANMRASTEAAGFGPSDRSFSWLPLYHDMGLVGGLLLGIYLGIPTYVMPTRVFVGRPDSWLRAMTKFRATFSCAPNFAYSMLARRLPDSALQGLDLSHWRLAFDGAEPIDRSTMEAFVRRFAVANLAPEAMFPVYGMAECTLAAAFPRPRALPRYDFVDRHALGADRRALKVGEDSSSALCFVSVGRAVPGHRIRILDPEGTAELAERHVGEIAISGPSVTPYYFRRDADYPLPRKELRTGDLGYIADGDLFIVDRLKDLLIVGGRNIVPSDVERLVAGVNGVRYGSVVAFAVRGSEGTDELCVVAGIEPRADREHVKQQSRSTLYQHFGIVPKDVILVRSSAIPRTSSGKLRRAACRDLYERGAMNDAGGDREPTV